MESKQKELELNTLRKKRVSTILKSIYRKEEKEKLIVELEEIEDKLFFFSERKAFSGENGFEVSYIKNYEKTIFYLSKHFNIPPKQTTIREFFTAFYDLKSKAEREAILHAKKNKR